ncbi:protein kinase [Kitasatospora sp. NPDC088346]|uniref:protein kinase domain-containing protein n=1 Tax=Kitasatospora sp. NPDC088346 TaxID=3364073 RepID=UPI0038061AFF
MRAAPGQMVAGRYRVTDRPEIGVAAQDLRTGGQVLLHALELPELLIPGQPMAEPDPEYGPRIALRVAEEVAAAPRHPRLLVGVDVVAEGDTLWVAEERLPGARLSELAGQGPVPPYRVAELGADLAGALRALHEAGLPHGNVTADSVLVCEDGAALLGGLLLGVAEETLCSALGGPVPRRVYEARAVLLGPRAERWPPDAGPEADCWALGVLLYRLLTGYGPYPEDDLPTLLAAVRDGRTHPADGCGPLRSLVERLLAVDPAGRPDAVQVQRELRELLVGAPEPFGPEPAVPPLLPVRRPDGPVVPYRGRAGRAVGRGEGRTAGARPSAELTHRHRAPLVPPALLGPLLVGGVLVALLAALAAVVLVSG